MSEINCNESSLDPYVPSTENPWNVSRIKHLYRRAAFGATKSQVIDGLSSGPNTTVDQLVDNALALLPSPPLAWSTWTEAIFEAQPEGMGAGFLRTEGKKQMVLDQINNNNTASNSGLRDRMTLFWSNHLVTEDDVIGSPAYQNQYYFLLQQYAMGGNPADNLNFKEFIYQMGISTPMLVYLDGDRSTRNRPNENYARELYELFTLGVNNGYTETDIIETAKALTGWTERNRDVPGMPITFNASRYDSGTKTIFGQTAAFDHQGVIDNLFAQRGDLIAQFICSKLYAYFVSANCEGAFVAGIINEMAQTFIANDFNVAPVLRQLFKSQHFFDQEAIGVIIKSPIDLIVNFYNESGLSLPTSIDFPDFVQSSTRMLQQDLLDPLDVAGWPGGEFWISPSLLLGRWESIRFILNAAAENPTQFSNCIIGLPIDELGDGVLTTSTRDVVLVVRTITNHFFSRGLTDPILFNEAVGVFQGNVPIEYFEPTAVAPFMWDLSSPELANQFIGLLDYIAEIPEFQLK